MLNNVFSQMVIAQYILKNLFCELRSNLYKNSAKFDSHKKYFLVLEVICFGVIGNKVISENM